MTQSSLISSLRTFLRIHREARWFRSARDYIFGTVHDLFERVSATADAMLEGMRNVPVQTAVARLGVGADPPFEIKHTSAESLASYAAVIGFACRIRSQKAQWERTGHDSNYIGHKQ